MTADLTEIKTAPKHPAKFSNSILDVLDSVFAEEAERRGARLRVLDPMAGTGRIHELDRRFIWETHGVELEEEWAAMHPCTEHGDATNLSLANDEFDAVCTSPCLEQAHLILTDDLRWVPAGDVRVGDRVLAFDEHSTSLTSRGIGARRRWRRAEVLRSVPRAVECVRVILSNGDEIVTTPEHPWLANRYSYNTCKAEWVRSCDLVGSPGAGGGGRGHRRGLRQPYHVMLQVRPWRQLASYDAGWLSGMFDGEGSLSLGTHGAPKMQLCQVEGSVLDHVESIMDGLGYNPNRIKRNGTPEYHKPTANMYVTGGFPGMMKALGELRPIRLLEKWAQLDLSTRTVEAEKVAVLAVEPAGVRDIQEIETTEGTYIGEGYLMHNCYGNRMADHHNAKDIDSKTGKLSKRMTYKHQLGRDLSQNSGGRLQWGAKYRELHVKILGEMVRVTKPGGLVVVNISNHYRTLVKGEPPVEQQVSEWWLEQMMDAGLELEKSIPVETPRMGFGANRNVRVEFEWVHVTRKLGGDQRQRAGT